MKEHQVNQAEAIFLFLFSFFILLRCHFQRICPFFFHLRELRFMQHKGIQHYFINLCVEKPCKNQTQYLNMKQEYSIFRWAHSLVAMVIKNHHK